MKPATSTRDAPRPAPAPEAARHGVGAAMMLVSSLSSQVGAATGALAFPVLGPVGVVAVRQWVAGVILLAVGRPKLRAFSARQWRLVLTLAAVFGTMNLALYCAIARIGLGLAVTLEFLGPLGVALGGALVGTANRQHRPLTLGCAATAAAGVVVLTRPQPSSDYLGVGLAVLAALCWAAYILLNRTLGASMPGVEGSAAAGAVSALVYVPIGIVTLIAHPPTLAALGCAAAAGLLSSAIPFASDLLALRRVPPHFFGIFASVNPVYAALVGALVLGEALSALDLLGIGLVVSANAVSLLVTAHARARRPADVDRAGLADRPSLGQAG